MVARPQSQAQDGDLALTCTSIAVCLSHPRLPAAAGAGKGTEAGSETEGRPRHEHRPGKSTHRALLTSLGRAIAVPLVLLSVGQLALAERFALAAITGPRNFRRRATQKEVLKAAAKANAAPSRCVALSGSRDAQRWPTNIQPFTTLASKMAYCTARAVTFAIGHLQSQVPALQPVHMPARHALTTARPMVRLTLHPDGHLFDCPSA